MKKIVLTTAVLLTLGLASCKKDYSCECKITRTSGGNTLTTVDETYTFKDNRARAESRCNDQEGTGNDAFGDYTRDCEIK
jgi:hypothetical protein